MQQVDLVGIVGGQQRGEESDEHEQQRSDRADNDDAAAEHRVEEAFALLRFLAAKLLLALEFGVIFHSCHLLPSFSSD